MLHDHRSYGTLSVESIITKSSNIGAAKIGIKMGENRLYDYIRDYGFGTPTGLPLQGEVGGIVHPVKKWSKVSLSRIPMGQGIAVTMIPNPLAVISVARVASLEDVVSRLHALVEEDVLGSERDQRLRPVGARRRPAHIARRARLSGPRARAGRGTRTTPSRRSGRTEARRGRRLGHRIRVRGLLSRAPQRSPSLGRTRGTGPHRRPSWTSGCGDSGQSARKAAPRAARASRSGERGFRPSRGRGSGS